MGKSTLGNSLSTAIPKLHVCREGDYSPVDLAWCTWMTKKEYDAVLHYYKPVQEEILKNTVRNRDHFIISYTKIITDIPGFHKELEKYEVYNGKKTLQDLKRLIFSRYRDFSGTGYVFECAFFQNILETFMLYYLLDDEKIIEFYRELYRVIDKKQFLLLYLYSDKLEENIHVIKQERCDQSGNAFWYPLMLEYLARSPYGEKYGCNTFEDMVSHFKHRQQLELRIIKEIIGGQAMILPAKEWKTDKILSRIC